MAGSLIKVGFCVAYDWHFLAHSLPLIYDRADVICLSIDEGHFSWTKKSFDFDETGFNEFINRIDRDNKIIVYKENFHLDDLTAAQNEVRQRNLMAKNMGEDGWHIQLDCDEYFLDFDRFVEYLKRLPDYPYFFNVCCPFATLFKQMSDGFLYVWPANSKQIEFFQIAMRKPVYEFGRRNGHFNIHTNFLVIHQSWARSEAEILQKLRGWGHAQDFDVESYFQFWRSVSFENHDTFRNFHPIRPTIWPALKFMGSKNVNELVHQFRMRGFPSLSPVAMFLKNSKWVSRLKSRLRLVL